MAAIVGPMAIHMPGASGAEPVGYGPREIDYLSTRIEQAYLIDSRGPLAFTLTAESSSEVPRRYPDGIAPVGKEVDSRPIGRLPSVE